MFRLTRISPLVIAFTLLSACGATTGMASMKSDVQAAVTAAMTPTPSASAINIYAATTTSQLKPAIANFPERVYVPNEYDNSLTVIDPISMQIIGTYPVGRYPEHVTPSWDMTKLYVDNEGSGSLSVIDPATGKLTGEVLGANDPYNLYFTPDGSKAIVVQEILHNLEFRDAKTWAFIKDLHIPFDGIDHMDFTPDGRYAYMTAEFSGQLIKVDLTSMSVDSFTLLGGQPIDIKFSPDGTFLFVANMAKNGVYVVDPVTMKETQFIPTGMGPHGLYYSRDTKRMFVTNRMENTISVIGVASRTVIATWKGLGNGPDMGQLNPDGTQFWVPDRYGAGVDVISTVDGHLIKHFNVGTRPHGLCYFPAPGNYSLGHNGIYR